ncbi:DUF3265 domain-containing protein [Vibrio sp. JPW-9-11-11]|nr:DUF3265 domain-containing protein [Vibrio sp. JPW-9-11-11]
MQADPQRSSILVCFGFGVYGVMRKVRQCVSGYLIGRYIYPTLTNMEV